MKRKLTFATLAILALGSLPAGAAKIKKLEGAVSGGGGKGVVCRDAAGEVRSVELLDLWEARTLFKKQLPTIPGSMPEIVFQKLDSLKNSYPFNGSCAIGGEYHEGQDCLLSEMRHAASSFWTENGNVLRLRDVTLTLTDDSYELARPRACAIEQIVNYQTNSRILLNQDLFEKMDALNQAALVAHEAYYVMLRGMARETNSIRVRRAIGHVFSGSEFSLHQPDLPETVLECRTRNLDENSRFLLWATETSVSDRPDIGTIAIYPHFLDGTTLIGDTNPIQRFGTHIDAVKQIVSGNCENGFGRLGIGGTFNGPIEFDRVYDLNWTCQDEKIQMHFTHYKPGHKAPLKSQMSCQSIETR